MKVPNEKKKDRDDRNVAQKIADALLAYTKNRTQDGLDEFLGEVAACIAELDARTYHVQR
jgi:hypothetical protein